MTQVCKTAPTRFMEVAENRQSWLGRISKCGLSKTSETRECSETARFEESLGRAQA